MHCKHFSIAHITSAHKTDDLRIFYKEVHSLHKKGFRVSLIGHTEKDEKTNDIDISSLSPIKIRFHRIVVLFEVLRFVKKKRPNLVHLHDPELLLLVPIFKWKYNLLIIFDSHESFYSVIRAKYWLPPSIRPMVAKLYALFQRAILRWVDGLIIVSNESIHEYNYYPCNKIATVQNFPILYKTNYDEPKRIQGRIIFVGRSTPIRGVEEMIQAMKMVNYKDAHLELIGPIDNQYYNYLDGLIRKLKLTDRVTLNITTDQNEITESIEKSQLGLALNYPIPNHTESLPTKVYTYMMNRLPIVISNIPLWNELIEKHNCGIPVDPYKPEEIANAIDKLLDDNELCLQMGKNGFEAVRNFYNWDSEFEKLFDLYKKIVQI